MLELAQPHVCSRIDYDAPVPEPTFEGIPYGDLPRESVDWTHRGEHIRTRSHRKGPREFDVDPVWATEAALDPRALIGPGSSASSVEVIGYSSSAPAREGTGTGRILKVWLVPKDRPPSGAWWGASACDANDHDRRVYDEG